MFLVVPFAVEPICLALTDDPRSKPCLVHGLEDEPELLGGAHEPDGVLEGEVDDADGVHDVQDGDHRLVAEDRLLAVLAGLVVVAVLRVLLLAERMKEGSLGTFL